MPSGYTSGVAEGTLSTRQFMLQCVRAFGAAVHLRGDPISPDFEYEVKPNDYSLKRARELDQELLDLELTSDEDLLEEEARRYQKRLDYIANQKAKSAITRARYEAALSEVEAWVPPTDEHIKYKEFMVKQLRDSISYDCGVYDPDLSPPETDPNVIRSQREDSIRKEIVQCKARWHDEVERAAEKTAWIKAVLDNLPSETSRD